jgi:hypothetical protein
MKIDGVGCSSCAINTCEANPHVDKAPLIDCSDFEGGAVLDLCETEIRVETGIFERFSIEEFQECLDHTPANGKCENSVAVADMPYQTSGATLMVTYDSAKSCGATQSFAPGLWYTVTGTGKGIEASVCEPKADRSDFCVHWYRLRELNVCNCIREFVSGRLDGGRRHQVFHSSAWNWMADR